MTPPQIDEEEIFALARRINDVDLRTKYLDQVCFGDPSLRSRLSDLLRENDDSTFLKSRFELAESATDGSELLGRHIGRYKLLQKIGEGGFGVVYMAEQQRPVRRKVALKVIKPGMDTNAVVARFEAERQALALMEHPHIARVLDGGASDEGRPFFVMELVKGVPITTYCDDNRLTIEDRLQLFTDVCEAVQHAHQKGIIHRDLKPSNVMVAVHENNSIAKVIDFGVAKAMHSELTEKTLFTAYGQMIGTPQYMSPEQAEMSGLDIDTRSDVYSLGVMLFELLTGSTPLDASTLRGAGYAKMQDLIKNNDPPKPSTRLSSSGDSLTHIAEHRRIAPHRLHRALSGDLDWIVMKSLDKDRSRRYRTADAIANDIHSYLNNEPIEARPPSPTYRLRKTIRRHRVPLTILSAFVLALSAGVFVSTWFAITAEHEKSRAVAARKETQKALTKLQDAILEQGFAHAFAGDVAAVDRLADDAKLAGLDEEWQLTLRATATFFNGEPHKAITLIEPITTDDQNVAALALLGIIYNITPEWTKYEQIYRRVYDSEPRPTHRDFDQFLLTLALGGRDSEKYLNELDAILDRHKTWVVPRLLVGEQGFLAAAQFEEKKQLEAAVHQSASVANLFPNNKFIAQVHAERVVGALEYSKRTTQSFDDSLLREAGEVAERLKNYKINSHLRPHIFDMHGDDESAKKEWLDVAGRASPTLIIDAVGYLYREGYETEAWDILQQRGTNTPEERVIMAYMLADDSERRDEAVQLCLSALEECPTWWMLQISSKALLLLGEVDRVNQICLDQMDRAAQWTTVNPWVYLDRISIEYLSGRIDKDEYMQADESAMGKLFCHLNLGCLEIGRGNRVEAEKHFSTAVHNSTSYAPESNWARAFLKRVRSDPEWPRGCRVSVER